MLMLSGDTEKKVIDLKVNLAGEESPLQIQMNGFEIREDGNEMYLYCGSVSIDRAWMNKLAQEYFQNNDAKVRIPDALKGYLKMVELD